MHKALIIFILIALTIVGVIYINHVMAKQEKITTGNTLVRFETNKGLIVIELYDNEMPITSGNFKKLVEEGFYDGVIFQL